jgi:ferric-dicitrate binding protein FerR (iron transport regulator)
MMKNKNELLTLLDKPCDPNAQLSKEELHQLDFLLGCQPEDECVTKWMRQDWEENLEFSDEINRRHIFARVKQQIEPHSDKRLSFMQFFYRCAAALLLPFIGLSVYFFIQTMNISRHTHTEIVENLDQAGIQSRITLSDGSMVTLKDGSRLNLKSNFNENTREVMLEGEAFFDIAHNPDKPFIIHTKGIRTTALGTAFTVRAAPNETSIIVTVVEGKVKVEDGEKLLAALEANQQFTFGIESEFLQEKMFDAEIAKEEMMELGMEAKIEKEVDWQPHDLVFRNVPFGDIVREIAIRHNVNIVFENDALSRQRIDALLDIRNPIETLLDLLCASQRATYTVERGTYTIRTKN